MIPIGFHGRCGHSKKENIYSLRKLVLVFQSCSLMRKEVKENGRVASPEMYPFTLIVGFRVGLGVGGGGGGGNNGPIEKVFHSILSCLPQSRRKKLKMIDKRKKSQTWCPSLSCPLDRLPPGGQANHGQAACFHF